MHGGQLTEKERNLEKINQALIDMQAIIDLSDDQIPIDVLRRFYQKYVDDRSLKAEFRNLRLKEPRTDPAYDAQYDVAYNNMIHMFEDVQAAIWRSAKSTLEKLNYDIAELQQLIDADHNLTSKRARIIFFRYYDAEKDDLRSFDKYSRLDPSKGEILKFLELQDKFRKAKKVLLQRGVIARHELAVTKENKAKQGFIKAKKSIAALDRNVRDLLQKSELRREKTQARKLAESADKFENSVIEALRKSTYSSRNAEDIKRKYQEISKQHHHLKTKGIFAKLKELLPGQNRAKYQRITSNLDAVVTRYEAVNFMSAENLFTAHPLVARFKELKDINEQLLQRVSLKDANVGASLLMNEINANYKDMIALLQEMRLELGRSKNVGFRTYLSAFQEREMKLSTTRLAESNEAYSVWLTSKFDDVIRRIDAYLSDSAHDQNNDAALIRYRAELAQYRNGNKNHFIGFNKMAVLIDYERQLRGFENLLARQKLVAGEASVLVADIDLRAQAIMQSRPAAEEENVNLLFTDEVAQPGISRVRNQAEIMLEIQKRLADQVELTGDLKMDFDKLDVKAKNIIDMLNMNITIALRGVPGGDGMVPAYQVEVSKLKEKLQDLREAYLTLYKLEGNPSKDIEIVIAELEKKRINLVKIHDEDTLVSALAGLNKLVDVEQEKVLAKRSQAQVALMKQLAKPVVAPDREESEPPAPPFDSVEAAHDGLTAARGSLEGIAGIRDGLTEEMVSENERRVQQHKAWVPKIAEQAEAIKTLITFLKQDREVDAENATLQAIEIELIAIAKKSLTDPQIELDVRGLLARYIGEQISKINNHADLSNEEYQAFTALRQRISKLPENSLVRREFEGNEFFQIYSGLYQERMQADDNKLMLLEKLAQIAEMNPAVLLAGLNRWRQFQLRNKSNGMFAADKSQLIEDYAQELKHHEEFVGLFEAWVNEQPGMAINLIAKLREGEAPGPDLLDGCDRLIRWHAKVSDVMKKQMSEIDQQAKEINIAMRSIQALQGQLSLVEKSLSDRCLLPLQKYNLERFYVQNTSDVMDKLLGIELSINDVSARPQIKSMLRQALLATSPVDFWGQNNFNADFIKRMQSDNVLLAQFLHYLADIPEDYWLNGRIDVDAVLNQCISGSLTIKSLNDLVRIDEYNDFLKTQTDFGSSIAIRDVINKIEKLEFVDLLESKNFFPVNDDPEKINQLKAFLESVPEEHWRRNKDIDRALKACLNERADINNILGFIDLNQYAQSVINSIDLNDLVSECGSDFGLFRDLFLSQKLESLEDGIMANADIQKYRAVTNLLQQANEQLAILVRDKRALDLFPSPAMAKQAKHHHEAAQSVAAELSRGVSDLKPQVVKKAAKVQVGAEVAKQMEALQQFSLHKPTKEAEAKLKKYGVTPLPQGPKGGGRK